MRLKREPVRFSVSFSQKKKKNTLNTRLIFPRDAWQNIPQGSYSKFHKSVERILLLSDIYMTR